MSARPDRAAAQFATRIDPYDLHFNSAHFITYGQVCENLHGHNFHVRLDAAGVNTQDGYVIDFVALNRLAGDVCASLHDRVLLPGASEVVRIAPQGEDMWCVESFGKRFVLQQSGCLILPVANTTAELLAWYISERLLAALAAAGLRDNLTRLQVAVEEADRQWGVCTRTLDA